MKQASDREPARPRLLNSLARVRVCFATLAPGVVFVKGLSQHLAGSEEEALSLLFEGEANRAIAEHQLNKASSRSHTIFTLSMELRGAGGDASADMLCSKLNLVDLAGSERLSKTKSSGLVAREAQHINKSLSFLEQVIIALGEKNREHIPYRSSKLTHMLKDSLGGNCKTIMIANVWAESVHLEETLSTCNFAKRMMRVTQEPSKNVSQDPSVLVRKLQRELTELKQELAMHDSFAENRNTGRAQRYDPYSEVERAELRPLVLQFLESDGGPGGGVTVEPLEPLTSLRQVREILLQARSLYKAACRPSTAGGSGRRVRPSTPSNTTASASVDVAVYDEAGAVGDLEGEDDAALAVLGVAPADARPNSSGGAGRPPPEKRTPAAALASSPAPPPTPPPDKNKAYEDYKKGAGLELTNALIDNKAALKERRRRAKDLGLRINAIKREMDDAKAHQDLLAAERAAGGGETTPDGAEVVSEEEYATLLRLKELKRDYRELYEDLKAVRSEAGYTEKLIEQCTSTLLMNFGEWYAAQYGDAAAAALEAGGVSVGGGVRLAASSASPAGSAGVLTPAASNSPGDSPRGGDRSVASSSPSGVAVDDEDAAAAFYNAQSATLRATKRGATGMSTPQRRAAGASKRAF